MTSLPMIRAAADWLSRHYDDKRALFTHDWSVDDPGYEATVVAMAALQRYNACHDSDWHIESLVEGYLDRHADKDTNLGNQGLLLRTLIKAGNGNATDRFKRLWEKCPANGVPAKWPIITYSRVLMGLVHYAAGRRDAIHRQVTQAIDDYLAKRMFPGTAIPLEQGLRSQFVSFEAICHHLWFMAEASRELKHPTAWEWFKRGLSSLMTWQRNDGAWPAIIDAKKGQPHTWYPIRTSAQVAWSALPLLSGFTRGIPGCERPLKKSFQYALGQNELDTPLLTVNPMAFHGGIDRRGSMLGGIGRIGRNLTGGESSKPLPANRLVLREEFAGADVAWLLFTWSGHEDAAAFLPLFDT